MNSMTKAMTLLIAILFCSIAKAEIFLPSIFSDGLSLQQNQQVSIWGKGTRNTTLTIRTSWNKQTLHTTVDDKGKWTISFQTPSHTVNQWITITDSQKQTKRISNILIGDVWLCGGQSNMEFPVGKHPTKKWMNGITNYENELLNADYPEIHLFHVERQQNINAESDDVVGHWMVCTPENAYNFSAIGFLFIRRLFNETHIPMAMIEDCWAGTHAESWIPMNVMQQKNSFYKDVLTTYAPENIKRDDDICKIPASLWNGMIAPVSKFSVKGCIWYQGESNCERADRYAEVMTDLINSWRQRMNNPLMPFYMVQIAPHSKGVPELRQAQVDICKRVPNTALAIITDAGDENHIHPQLKQPVAERLARIALSREYNKPIAYRSPQFESMSINGNEVSITFSDAPKGLISIGSLHTGFLLSGSDNRFYPADCRIEGNKVHLSSSYVKVPVAVRFGWGNYAPTNLYSTDSLPVTPFRTDTFSTPAMYRRFADSEILRFPKAYQLDHGKRLFFGYAQGVGCMAMLRVWKKTGDRRYFDYVKEWADSLVDAKGNIFKYKPEEFQLDFINSGKVLLTLYKETGDRRYRLAINRLIAQLRKQPRTQDGAYWHKKVYPHQMWLDGLYMAAPFMAEYATLEGKARWTKETLRQFSLCHRHLLDSTTGLYYHGWDASLTQKWANPQTGCSPSFWGRSIGWLAMAMVDALDNLPSSETDSLRLWFHQLIDATLPYQSRKGLWYQVIDQPTRKGNFPEASVSAQLMYAIARGVNRGYLPESYREYAEKAYKGICSELIRTTPDGALTLTRCCQVGGLGGRPYRDGSFEYYIGEKMRNDDAKATGPFIMGAIELNK